MACTGCLGQEEFPEEGEAPSQARRPWGWRPIAPAAEARLAAVLRAWEGTPYAAGQRVRGAGVDCIHFVAAVLDAMERRPEPTAIPRLPVDAGVHHDQSRKDGMLDLMLGLFPSDRVAGRTVEPGDIVVARGEPGDGQMWPGHALVAGVAPYSVVHAAWRHRVVRTTLSAAPRVIAVYRPRSKPRWT